MKNLSINLLLVLLASLVLAGTSSAQDADSGKRLLQEVRSRVKTVDTETLKKMIDNKEDFVLLDVRPRADVESMGAIDAPQQVNIERSWLESRTPDLVELVKSNPDKPIITYCGVGELSAYSADTLQRLGFKNVYSYDAGYLEWESKGYKVKYDKK